MSARPAFSFCVCPDASLSKKWIASMLVQSGEQWRQKTYWADEGLSDLFWQDLSSPSLLPEPKALIVRYANTLLTESWKELSVALAGRKQYIWSFFCLEGEWNRGKPAIPAAVGKTRCFEFAQKQGWVWQNPGFNRAGVKKEVQKRLAAGGIQVNSDILQILCERLPLDARALELELDKLFLHLGERKTLVFADLELFASYAEIDIFAFLQALQNKKSLSVWTKILQEQVRGEGFLFPFLGLMANEARVMWQLLGAESSQVHLPQFVLNQKKQLAKSLGQKKIIMIFDLLVQAEFSVKSGQASPEQALEMLVVQLDSLMS